MKIKVKGYEPKDFRKSLKDKIENNEIRTWEFIQEGRYQRLLHTGDDQYSDVVVRLVAPSEEDAKNGILYTEFIPSVRETVKNKKDISTAISHFGVVLGRFAELLNCHYPEIGEYKTILSNQ